MKTLRERIVAHHEAGHALAAIDLNISFNRVFLTSRPSGQVCLCDEADEKNFYKLIIFAFAGPIAESVYSGSQSSGSSYDLEGALSLLQRFGGRSARKRERIYQTAWVTAEQMVHIRWRGIQRIARRLLRDHELTREQVCRAASGRRSSSKEGRSAVAGVHHRPVI